MLTADLLSQDEIKALLGNADEEVETAMPGDVSHQAAMINDDCLTVADTIQARFKHFFANDLYSFIRTPAELSTCTALASQFADYSDATPAVARIDASLYSTVTKPILLALDEPLVWFIMDCFFGGSGDNSYRLEKRAISVGEIHIARLILTKVTSSLEKAWIPLTEFSFKLQLPPADLWINKIMRPDEPVAIFTTQIKLKNTQGNLQIVLPTSLLNTT